MHQEFQYLHLLRDILNIGVESTNRTKVNTTKSFGHTMRFDLSNNTIPLFTTKKVYWKGIVHELLWFIRGETNCKYLQENGVHIWDLDAQRHKERVEKLGEEFFKSLNKDSSLSYPWYADNAYYKISSDGSHEFIGDGELGPIYGHQWRNFGGNILVNGIDQLAEAIKKLQTNPNDRRIIVSAWNPLAIEEMGLPPCFIKGTLIKVENGYSEIQDLKISEKVVDNNGDLQHIKRIWKTPYEGVFNKIKLKYNREEIICTPNHPFLVMDKSGKIYYKNAKDIESYDLVALIKHKSKNLIPKFNFKYSNQYSEWEEEYTLTKEDAFVLGYYLGDGWSNEKDNRICFSINIDQENEILPKIRECIKVSLKRNEREDLSKVNTYETRNKNKYKIFSEFGNKSKNKKIPHWVSDLPLDYIDAFLEGYQKSDGIFEEKSLRATSISSSVAYGIQYLMLQRERLVSVCRSVRQKTTEICGRIVNQEKYLYHLNETKSCLSQTSDNYEWIPVFKNEEINKNKIENYDGFVYNFEVENTNTYTSFNIVTHNCHILFQFGVQDNKYLTCALYQRSCDMFLGVPFNVASYSLLTHIIAKATGLEAKEFVWFGFDCHIYDSHRKQIIEQISRDPFPFPKIKIDKKINNSGLKILDNNFLKFEDFELENYKSHPPIKGELADY